MLCALMQIIFDKWYKTIFFNLFFILPPKAIVPAEADPVF
jgi:hypothetical protein